MTIKYLSRLLVFSCFLAATLANAAFGQKVLRVGVAGLTHDHVHNIMHQFKTGQVIIAGIAESDPANFGRPLQKDLSCLPDSLFLQLVVRTHRPYASRTPYWLTTPYPNTSAS